MENEFDVRINRALYKRLVAPKKFVEKLSIQCKEASTMEIVTNSDLYGQSDEIYQYNCSKSTLTSLNIRCGYKTLQFDVSNIQYSMDKAVYNVTQTNAASTFTNPSLLVDKSNIPLMVDNGLGIASPLNFFALASDPINAIANTTVKIDNFESKTQVSDTQLDFYNRMYDAEDLRNSENFLMLPDTTQSYNYNNNHGIYIDGKKALLSSGVMNNNFDYSTILGLTSSVVPLQVSKHTDLQQLKYDKMNPLGLLNRGQMQIDPSSIKFSKAVPSPNYTFNGEKFVAGNNATTELYTISFGGNYYPANITQADFETSGRQLRDAIFFYDKDNSLALNVFYGKAPAGPPNPETPLPTEPAGQSLSMSFQYQNVEGSIENDITTRMHDNDVIGNISGITVTRNLRSDPSAILKCLLPYQCPLNGQLYQNVQLNLAAASYAQMKGLVINVTRIGGYVRLQQYSAPTSLAMPTVSSHPYVKREQTTEDISKVLLGGSTWAAKCANGNKLTYELTSKNFTMVPKAVAIWVNTRNQNDSSNRHGSTNRRATITNYQLKVGQQPYLFSDRNRKAWFDLAKQNGLKNYDYAGFCTNGYAQSYNPKSITGQIGGAGPAYNIIQNFSFQSIEKLNDVTVPFCSGNFIFYSFDDNIPLPDGYTASTSQFNQNLQHKLELYCEDTSSTFAEVNVVYFYDHQLLCDPNSAVSVVDVPLYFTPEQVLQGLNKVQTNVNGEEYRSKISNVGYGSSLFSSALDKVKSKLPSVHRMKGMLSASPKTAPLTEHSGGAASSSRPKTMRDFFKQ